jgi:peroxisome-assembly ATPase
MPAGSASTSLSITNPLVLYRALIATNRIRPDPAQHRLALQLQKLYYRLKDYDPELEYRHRLDQIAQSIAQPREPQRVAEQRVSRNKLISLWRRSMDGNVLALTRTIPMQESAMKIESPQGMLLYGEVGRGKSMLLDLLYDSLPSRKKRRWHFNTFMLDVFRRLESVRIERMRNPNWKILEQEHSVLSLARNTITTSPILFLDEFQLPDRTSSKLLNGFMTSFFHLGGVLVASSNRMPEELAKAAGVEFVGRKDVMGSLFGWTKWRSEGQRAAQSDFGQFLEVLKARCEVWEMEGERDWRREYDDSLEEGTSSKAGEVNTLEDSEDRHDLAAASTSLGQPPRLSSDTPTHYHIAFSPSSPDYDSAAAAWSDEVQTLNSSQNWQPSDVRVYGRTIHIPQTSKEPPGVARFSFLALCASNLGPADYITIASTFHTIVLIEVPVLTLLRKNEARRFITLLDALYESKCRLLIQAAAPPDSLFFPETSLRRRDNGELSTIHTPSNEKDSNDSVYQETLSEIYQDSLQSFRPNISTYNSSNDTSATPTSAFELRSVLADEDADFGPTYGNGRGQSQSGGDAGLAETIRRQQAGPDFTKTSQLTGEDERFAYKRARSRLWEMCGKRWWKDRRNENVEEWWRPVAREGRHWEKSTADISAGETGGQNMRGSHDGSSRLHGDLDKRLGTRNDREWNSPPTKLDERHVWGLGLWGPKAGRWGRGQMKEKKTEAGEEPNPNVDLKQGKVSLSKECSSMTSFPTDSVQGNVQSPPPSSNPPTKRSPHPILE